MKEEIVKIFREVTPKNRRSMIIPFIFVFAYLTLCLSFILDFTETGFAMLFVYAFGCALIVMAIYYYFYLACINMWDAKFNIRTYNGMVIFKSTVWALLYLAFELYFNMTTHIDALLEAPRADPAVLSFSVYTKIITLLKYFVFVSVVAFFIFFVFGKYTLKGKKD